MCRVGVGRLGERPSGRRVSKAWEVGGDQSWWANEHGCAARRGLLRMEGDAGVAETEMASSTEGQCGCSAAFAWAADGERRYGGAEGEGSPLRLLEVHV